MNKNKYPMYGIRPQMHNIVRLELQIKKHFLYIDAIDEVKGNKVVLQKLRQMIVMVEKLKKNVENYRKTLNK